MTQSRRGSWQAWRSRALPIALILAAPLLARADISIRPIEEMPVELVRPTDGELLEAGREATVEWRALRDLSAEGIHEWEAFLSFDGGRQWPARITPHLDADLSSFRFVVPLIPSDDVRLMLRFGDERREVGYVLPLALRSVVPARGWLPASLPTPVLGYGEAARPGVKGVVLWAEGGRNGRRVEIRATTWSLPTLWAACATRPPLWPLLVAPETRTPEHAVQRTRNAEPWSYAVQGRPPVRRAMRSLPLLRFLCRQNE